MLSSLLILPCAAYSEAGVLPSRYEADGTRRRGTPDQSRDHRSSVYWADGAERAARRIASFTKLPVPGRAFIFDMYDHRYISNIAGVFKLVRIATCVGPQGFRSGLQHGAAVTAPEGDRAYSTECTDLDVAGQGVCQPL